MPTTSKSHRIAGLVIALGLLGAACGSTGDAETGSADRGATEASTQAVSESLAPLDPPATAPEPAIGLPVQVRDTSQGQVLETPDGKTIYGNFTDVLGKFANCPGGDPEWCASFTPVLSPTGDVVSDGLDPNDYRLIDNPLGQQLSIIASSENGVPLYTSTAEGPGEFSGNDHFGTWYPISSIGKLMNTFDPDLAG